MEYTAFVFVLLTGLFLVLGLSGKSWLPRVLAGALVATGVAATAWWQPSIDRAAADLPAPPRDGDFVTSDTCQSCHPDHYDSWYASFHRSMTQPADPSTILAPFDGVQLQHRGRTYQLERIGDDFWIDMVDPAWEMRSADGIDPRPLSQAPRIRERVVMVTGSHHLQVYWTRRSHEDNGMLFQFPWVYHIADARWVPSESSFLRPPTTGAVDIEDWNSSCILCHSVGGRPHMDQANRSMYSEVAQFGIACEACHGEAGEHVAAMKLPWTRYALHLTQEAPEDIVNPQKLDSRRSSEVCGNCHSASNEIDPEQWMKIGRTFRPGDDLSKTRRTLRYTETPTEEWMVQGLRNEPDALVGRFWPDGTIRVTGREFNGLVESACFQDGDLSCLSCHSMHDSDPNDQLAEGMDTDQACLGCHESYSRDIEAHTHHQTESSGSRCQNCHMPHTTYGLFSAIRSHRIDNPKVSIQRGGRPNACNLCHLDKSQGWTADHLTEWYDYVRPELPDEDESVAASALWVLKGDAVQRAITAWAMGWEPARLASGAGWQGPVLGYLLDDPYAAVRYVACRSIQATPGYEDFECDFLEGAVARRDRIDEAWRTWESLANQSVPDSLTLDRSTLEGILRRRDNRPLRIIE